MRISLNTLATHLLHRGSEAAGNYQTKSGINLVASISPHQAQVLDQASEIRKLAKIHNLEPVYDTMLCCPRCLTSFLWRGNSPYPISVPCPSPSSSGAPCNEPIHVSSRLVHVQKLNDWLGKMLSRPWIEEALDKASKELRVAHESISSCLDARVIRDLQTEGGKPFLPSSGTDLHIVMSFNDDDFNSYGMKPGGAKYQTKGVFMSLLSLPIELRNLAENIFIALAATGPHTPKGQKLGSLLTPIVNELLRLRSGVFFTKTSLHPEGRLVRVMLPCVINDLLAALDLLHLPHFANEAAPCAFCLILRSVMEYEDAYAPPRLPAEKDRLFAQWAALNSADARAAFERKHSVSYPELQRLPYFNEVRMKVLEPMHAFQNIIKDYLKTLGMDAFKTDATKVAQPPAPSDALLSDARQALQSGDPKRVRQLSIQGIIALCNEKGIRYAGSKAVLTSKLWVRKSSASFSYRRFSDCTIQMSLVSPAQPEVPSSSMAHIFTRVSTIGVLL